MAPSTGGDPNGEQFTLADDWSRYVTVLLVSVGTVLTATVGRASAHVGGFSGAIDSGSVPTWLTIGTGGIIIGASFLFATLMTDQSVIERVNRWSIEITTPWTVVTTVRRVAGLASVVGLVVILASGFLGRPSRTNLAILVIWTGWWAGFTMTTYLVGNSWPILNPWRVVAEVLPSRDRPIGQRRGTTLSIVGLLGLVWLEVVSPVATRPKLLGAVVIGYTVVTVIGTSVYGHGPWFRIVDPVSRVFRAYGRLAPVQRTSTGISIRLPGSVIAERDDAPPPGTAGFVVALLWVTTYDGLVATPAWAVAMGPFVDAGIPPRVLYLVTIFAGYGLFLGGYRRASRSARQTADTYITTDFIGRWFSTSLLPIAAGYHAAHFLGYFLTLSPSLLRAIQQPFGPMDGLTVAVLPGWFAILPLAFVLLGHVLAVWIAHARAVAIFPGILQPIRSQYPFILVMIAYTLVSLWVVTQPFTPPPYV